MALSILNNISSLQTQNQLDITGTNLAKTLQRLSSGSKVNSGADDAAGLAIADGLNANVAALTRSVQNATDGIGLLQTADGGLAQITSLLNRAVTLATEAQSGTLGTDQLTALNTEFSSIKDQIDNIGKTQFNGNAVFGTSVATVSLTDGTTAGTVTINTNLAAVDSKTLTKGDGTTAIDLSKDDLTTASNAKTALQDITDAIAGVSAMRGKIGASMNQLSAASNVMNTQIQNLASASNNISAADIGKEVASMTKYNILQQTGIAALQQSNQAQQSVLKLLQ